MYRYETHCHTSPSSTCAKSSVRDMLTMYKNLGYKGVFITNHFYTETAAPSGALEDTGYKSRVEFQFSDYEEGVKIGLELGLDIFYGMEFTYKGTDFLVYGLDKEWFLANEQIEEMSTTERLAFMKEAGALIIQAHPFREARYIDHIRLFPRSVHGVEVCNACRTDFENKMAKHYADSYALIHFAGSDAHNTDRKKFAGMLTESLPITDAADFKARVMSGEMKPFFFEIQA